MKIKKGMEESYKKLSNRNAEPEEKKVVEFIETWTSLMELELLKGEVKVADCAVECRKKANPDGTIDGVQYGYAIICIVMLWEHGEEFRRWHNLNCQLGDEGEHANAIGGVLNPALVEFK